MVGRERVVGSYSSSRTFSGNGRDVGEGLFTQIHVSNNGVSSVATGLDVEVGRGLEVEATGRWVSIEGNLGKNRRRIWVVEKG